MTDPKKVALLVRTGNDWSRQVLMGVAQFAQEQGGWGFTHPLAEKNGEVMLPPGWEGDGIICRLTSAELEASIIKSGIPAVNVSWQGKHSSEIVKVVSDERACGEVVATYFLERQYRNFAYVGFPPSLNYQPTIQESVVETLRKNHVMLNVLDYKNDHVRFDHSNSKGLLNWLKHLPMPLAVIVWDSNIASQMTGLCRTVNLRIPEDVSIVCIEHDDLVSSLSLIPLSNLDQDPWQVGYLAARHLSQMMNGEIESRSPFLIPPLSVTQRRSSESSAVEDEVVRNSYSFIHENITQGINVDDVVRVLDIPRRTLEKKFEEFLGMTPAKVIRRARTRVAKRLLRETTLSIQQVADRSGFSNADALFRTFRRETGQTPTQFRRANS